MGTSLDNLHVYVDNLSVEKALENIFAGLHQHMLMADFTEVTDAAAAQVTITIIADNQNPWISFYGNIPPGLEEAGIHLSQRVGYPVVTINVFDSDVTTVTLFAKGQKQDTYSNWINYDSHPPRISGDAAKWQLVLPKNHSPETLAKAWQLDKADYPFEAEGALGRIVEVLNLGRDRAWYDPKRDNELSASYILKLYFRYNQALPYESLAEGLPRFKPYMHFPKQHLLSRNQRFGLIFSVLNLGGASQGLEILAQGTAIDQKLIQPVGVITNSPFDHAIGTITALPELVTTDVNESSYRIRIEDYSIRAGVADFDAIYKLPFHLRDLQREFDLPHMLTFVGQAVNAGVGKLEIVVRPFANRELGAVSLRTEITVNELKAYKL
ncbi:MAG: hypothetical protein ABI690_25880 [Chloroflexota bacterium]